MIAFTYSGMGIFVFSIIAILFVSYLKLGKHYTISLDIYNGNTFKQPPLYMSVLYYIGCLLMIFGWLFTGIAAMEPVKIVSKTKIINTDCIILYILDASPSMSAADISPTRFAKAVELIEKSVTSSNALHALIAFGKDALLICPPTPQNDIFLERLHTLQPGICGDGTNILAALKSALVQIAAAKVHDSAIVLLSDGEDYESISKLSALFDMVNVQSSIYFAAIGKGGDIPVTYIDPFTQEETTGVYRSQFNEEKLKHAIESTAIKFFVNPDVLNITLTRETDPQKTIETSTHAGINILPYTFVMLIAGWLVVFGIIGGKL